MMIFSVVALARDTEVSVCADSEELSSMQNANILPSKRII
jgi:hypothetical protein